MSFETDIIEELEAIIGNSKIYPLKANETAALPYIVFEYDADEWEETLNESNDTVTSELILHIYANTYQESFNLSEEIKYGIKDYTSDDVLNLMLDYANDSFEYRNGDIICKLSQTWLVNHLL